MSVEEARKAVRAETVEAVTNGVMLPKWYAALDRLILEVQAAALPCLCPSCAAAAARRQAMADSVDKVFTENGWGT